MMDHQHYHNCRCTHNPTTYNPPPTINLLQTAFSSADEERDPGAIPKRSQAKAGAWVQTLPEATSAPHEHAGGPVGGSADDAARHDGAVSQKAAVDAHFMNNVFPIVGQAFDDIARNAAVAAVDDERRLKTKQEQYCALQGEISDVQTVQHDSEARLLEAQKQLEKLQRSVDARKKKKAEKKKQREAAKRAANEAAAAAAAAAEKQKQHRSLDQSMEEMTRLKAETLAKAAKNETDLQQMLEVIEQIREQAAEFDSTDESDTDDEDVIALGDDADSYGKFQTVVSKKKRKSPKKKEETGRQHTSPQQQQPAQRQQTRQQQPRQQQRKDSAKKSPNQQHLPVGANFVDNHREKMAAPQLGSATPLLPPVVPSQPADSGAARDLAWIQTQQLAQTYAQNARPKVPFSSGSSTDYARLMAKFDMAANTRGMDSRGKLLELYHWFDGPGQMLIDAVAMDDDPEMAYLMARAELNEIYGRNDDSTASLLRFVREGTSVKENDHQGHIHYYAMLIHAHATAKTAGNHLDFDRHDILRTILDYKFPHLTMKFWKKDEKMRSAKLGRMGFNDLAQMISRHIKILHAKGPSMKDAQNGGYNNNNNGNNSNNNKNNNNNNNNYNKNNNNNANNHTKNNNNNHNNSNGANKQINCGATSASTPQIPPSQEDNRTWANKADSPPRPQPTGRCGTCAGWHETEDCAVLAKMTPDDKVKRLTEKKLCFHCLQSGHDARNCTQKPRCKVCHQRHHTILHGRSYPPPSNRQSLSASAPAFNPSSDSTPIPLLPIAAAETQTSAAGNPVL